MLKKIVNDFLNHCNVKIEEKGIKVNCHGRLYWKREFDAYISRVFANMVLEDGTTSGQFVDMWYTENKKRLIGTLDTFLGRFDVKRASTHWLIYEKANNKAIDCRLIEDCFEDEFSVGYIRQYVDNWMTEKMIISTEKAMGIYNA